MRLVRRLLLPRRMRLFARLALGILVLYLALLAGLYWQQTALLYLPRNGASTPHEAGLAGYEARSIVDKESTLPIRYWEHASDAPPLLYFHGNGGGLFYHKAELAFLAQYFHVYALEYPGYPRGAAGVPSEAVLVAQAAQLYDAVAQAHGGERPLIWGFSLGSGVAAALAETHPPRAWVLEAPFTATVDRAQELFPFIPVSLLMRDQYRSREHIRAVQAPLMIIHGTADRIIPIAHGRRLYALANAPKRMQEYEGFGHLNLIRSTAYQDASAFLLAH